MFGIGVFELLVFTLIALVIFGLPLIVFALLIWLVLRGRRSDKRD